MRNEFEKASDGKREQKGLNMNRGTILSAREDILSSETYNVSRKDMSQEK
ncbi:hypothetical protein KSZ_51820 [Dictyobacter formicarum]|uniref:Uncharacterized protein n=1 Tax=Dictyobacter formicarum TaxID=2778368 RepID=A0ABQ3VP60_9CHLR|nr:hypothetical protein KSZ_51820 [Dictyobacter formicarum]